MMRMRLACLALVMVAGCDLYFGNGDDDPCTDIGYGGGAAPNYQIRNPETGQCEYGGGGYPYPCDDVCGRPCPQVGAADLSLPDWGSCYSACEGLDENSCQATPGCYSAYLLDAYDSWPYFWGCWQTAPSGPVQGRCEGLDAQECSRHDDCIAEYSTQNGTHFTSCYAEPAAACLSDSECGPGNRCDHTVCNPPPGCDKDCPNCGACPDVCYGQCVPVNGGSCAAVDCGPGYHCEEQCWSDTDPNGPSPGEMDFCSPVCVQDVTCANVLCAPNTECVEQCELESDGQWVCHATCVPVGGGDPGSCFGQVLCDAIGPACPSGTTAGIANGCYTGYCIPLSDCGPNDPGTCTGDVNCFANPPACPANTVPGIVDGCWSGYCIPTSDCPVPSCESLTTESTCTARNDCSPVYAGTNCTCDANGCTCQTLSFARCESAYMPF